MPMSECRLEKSTAKESVDILSRTRARMLESGIRRKSKDFKRVTILEAIFLRSRYLLLRNSTWCMDSVEKLAALSKVGGKFLKFKMARRSKVGRRMTCCKAVCNSVGSSSQSAAAKLNNLEDNVKDLTLALEARRRRRGRPLSVKEDRSTLKWNVPASKSVSSPLNVSYGKGKVVVFVDLLALRIDEEQMFLWRWERGRLRKLMLYVGEGWEGFRWFCQPGKRDAQKFRFCAMT